MSDGRYIVDINGNLKDSRSGFIIPWDKLWVMDLLNLKEERINELEDELDD